MKSLKRIVAPLLGAFLFVGCAANGDKPMNDMAVCIMSGEDCKADHPTADYMGHTVHFCCTKCEGKWNKMDDAAKKAQYDSMK